MTTIRPATEADVPEIFRMINELAEYEKQPQDVTSTEEDVRQHLFADNPKVFAHVAVVDGRIEGMALWFLNYSTWQGRHGIWLEDLYVREEARGKGLGTALLKELARIAVANDYRRVEWSVLKWNTPSIGFYTSIGANDMGDWSTMRLDGEALQVLGS
ncbi:GNAT family N-acetyltransferase [Corynebacterium aquatimens]|uniref:GNAT family N-acetyltransferase n=1 Tax=Corynebacterium TaxID=1716 RepID=UPI001F25EA12|nr:MULTISPECIES: GNAT family N-acetyltransferase [Corynebacterium]QYH19848.1 GNAT family N-acetyltransferase [Corynebacterium aquatimens]UIZ93004.1 GNAT family N-acetyltransferase [Corynebacterium sp. CNCTC7651]